MDKEFQKATAELGLVMTGGGARGAYQAGVLKRIGQIPAIRRHDNPFKIIAAASAGAVNGTALAVGSHDFSFCTRWIAKLWANLTTRDIYRSDLKFIVPRLGRMVKDIALGNVGKNIESLSLLDSTPLKKFLNKHLYCQSIPRRIEGGHLRALAIAATNYTSGKTYTFIQGESGHQTWVKSRRIALSTQIDVQHVCASAAIPVVFQPVKISTSMGTDFFGDGCLRMPNPLSPAIRLGAERILAIGVRGKKSTPEEVPIGETNSVPVGDLYPPPLAQILGVTLNAIFLDYLDSDVEHLERLNHFVDNQQGTFKGKEPIRSLRALAISPSQDLGEIASTMNNLMPTPVRMVLGGLGHETASSDLMSYLLFHSEYTNALIDLGMKDAGAQIDAIEDFIFRGHLKNSQKEGPESPNKITAS